MSAELNSTELYALGSGIGVCCNSAAEAFTTKSALKQSPADKKPEIDSLQSCVASVAKTANSACSGEYDLMKSCLESNKRSWTQCQELKRGLDLCLVKNKAGELAN